MLYLPQISVAKIDKSLIDKAEHNEREQLVIRHLINLCHDLNMRCVAEGIETDSQIELLKKLGCDKLQGYKIGKPMLPEAFASLEIIDKITTATLSMLSKDSNSNNTRKQENGLYCCIFLLCQCRRQ